MAEPEFAFHPDDDERHDISFRYDDIEATREDLQDKGVSFNSPVTDPVPAPRRMTINGITNV